jgi:hypothetical protein
VPDLVATPIWATRTIRCCAAAGEDGPHNASSTMTPAIDTCRARRHTRCVEAATGRRVLHRFDGEQDRLEWMSWGTRR